MIDIDKGFEKKDVHLTKFDMEVSIQHSLARMTCKRFNECSDADMQRKLLRRLFNYNIGEGVTIIPPLTVDTGNVTFGNNCFINSGVKFIDYGGITIGNNVGISVGTVICTNNHPCNPLILDKWVDIKEPVIIEDDVWIGANVVILGNVTIGKGAIIGAGSVVTKNVPAGEVWGGNPARFIETVQTYMEKKQKQLENKGQ